MNSTTEFMLLRVNRPFCPTLHQGSLRQEPLPGDATPGCPGRGNPSARIVLPGSQDPSSQPWVIYFQVFCLIFMYSMWTDYEVCRRIRAASSLVSRGDSEIPSLAAQGWHCLGCAEGRLCSMALVSSIWAAKEAVISPPGVGAIHKAQPRLSPTRPTTSTLQQHSVETQIQELPPPGALS